MPDITLEKLLSRSDIWCANHQPVRQQSLSTGLSQLDKSLHQGGWPCHGLTEVLLDSPGCGELLLIAPCLARLSQQPGLLALVAPPYIPYAPGLLTYGIDVSRILVIRTASVIDTLWATEQALRSGTCNSVVSWLPEHSVRHHQIRKLQLAAQQAHGLSVLLRPTQVATQHSPATLRIQLSTTNEKYQINIIKQRGGWGGQRISLPIPKQLIRRQLPVNHLPVYNKRRTVTAEQSSSIQPLTEVHTLIPHSPMAIH